MYEENEKKKINWIGVLKRLVFIVLAIVVIFGFIALVTRCSKNSKNNKPTEIEQINLTQELDQLQDATLRYLTKDNLPTELHASKTVKLKYLISKDLAEPIKDSNKNTCDSNKSYSEITRLENNYAVKMVMNCGKKSDYRIIYIGCFEDCNGELCIRDEETTGGICTIEEVVTREEPKEIIQTPTNNNSSSKNTNTNNNTGNNSNSNKTTTTKKNQVTTKKTTTVKKKELYYKYKRCTTQYLCSVGKITSDKRCLVKGATLQGKVKSTTTTTYKTSTVPANQKTEIKYYCSTGQLNGNVCKITTPVTSNVPASQKTEKSIVFFSSTTYAKNTSTVTYRYLGYDRTYGYKFEKTEIKYYCSKGERNGSVCVITTYKTNSVPASKKTEIKYYCSTGQLNGNICTITTPVTTTTYSCKDSSYTYNSSNNTCTKVIPDVYLSAEKYTDCDYKWSKETSLYGWTKTGDIKWK